MGMTGALHALTHEELLELVRAPEKTRGYVAAENEVSLEKMWQALHFVLNGTVERVEGPLGHAILGGKELGPDVGYGPARILLPDEVKATAAALARVTPADLRRR